MCGIAGAIGNLSNPSSNHVRARDEVKDCVTRVSAAMRHRGPDGEGLWEAESGDVVFAHRRLAVIDLSKAGAQPMLDPQSGCVITFNGEVYNFRELREELQSIGEQFHSNSDTEVVLKAFKHWGLDVVPRLRGIFAMAIWDPRSRSVHLIRDQLGVKPLYWTIARTRKFGSETLLFASEVRALLASDVVDRRLSPAAIASYLAHGFIVGPDTIVEGVELLPASTILTITPGPQAGDPNLQSIDRYWSLPSSVALPKTEATLREELEHTVRMQLVSDAPLGIFLSGGIDSSAIAALASKNARESVHTFTIGFDEASLDESRYAASVAQAIGSQHTNTVLREGDFLHQLPDALTAIDQPTFDGINTYFVSRAAREAGMTVALAGTGGDELFGGYSSFAELPKLLRTTSWVSGRTLGDLADGVSRVSGRLFWDVLRQSPPQTRWGKIADVVAAAGDLLRLYQVSYALFTRDTQARLASKSVRSEQSAQDFGLSLGVASALRGQIKDSELFHAISQLELFSFIGERLLRDTDAASMAVSLEVRVPLLDHVLCETVAAIDSHRRFFPLRKKQLLRDLALNELDPTIFDRPKAGFELPIDTWARRRLQSEMEHLLLDTELVTRIGLCPQTVATLWASFTAGKPGLYWSRVWSLYVLVAWCQRHDMTLAA